MGLSNSIVKMLAEEASQKRSPLTVNFELLPVCNLDCKMCYIRTDMATVNRMGGLLDADKWLELIPQMQEAGTLFILLTGGEVFLYPKFRYLYETLYNSGFILTINTNATMIDEDTVAWLKQYPPKCVSISLYGACNETYKALCGRDGMFDRVDWAISLLQQAGIAVECKTILTPLNLEDMAACIAYCKERLIPYELANYAFPPARKPEKGEQVRFTPEEAVQAAFARNRLLSTEEEYNQKIAEHLEKYQRTKGNPGCQQYGLSCSAANTACWINWQGKMTPCAMMNAPVAHPFETGFRNAWEELKNKSDQLKLCTACSLCDKRAVCGVCPASCYAETGKIDGKPEYRCRMAEYQLEEMERYARVHHLTLEEVEP